MMKLLFILTIAALCITSCKKDASNNTPNTPKIYLLSTLTYSTIPGGITSTEVFTYDSQNRVIEFNAGSTIFKYTYDDSNNLLTVQSYEGALTGTQKYSYSGNMATAQIFLADGTANGSYTFTFNSKQQVESFSGDNDNIQYSYDSNGNATGYSATGSLTQSDSYSYDNKKNPLSMIGAPNLHLTYLAQGVPLTNVNNILVDHIYPITYTYTYNSTGFPVSATELTNSGTGSNITYTYLTK